MQHNNSMKRLRILSILDKFTFSNLSCEPNIELLSNKPYWYLKNKPIDLLLVESAWRGNDDKWRHQIATYPQHPERNIERLKKLVAWCKDKDIPTVFWNKEDPFHYNQFIDAAALFDYVLTTDATSIKRYKIDALNSKIHVATFFIQPQIHYQTQQYPINRTLFMGTYDPLLHPLRRVWQDKIFTVAAPFGLDLVNRHPKHLAHFAFPQYEGDVKYFEPIPYAHTPSSCRYYQQILNVNTITDSPTMFSRRLIEIMACGRLAISNPSLAIDHLFKDMCVQVDDADEATQLFSQLQSGYTQQQRDMVAYAHEHVQQNYTAKAWLKSILETCQLDHPYLAS